MMGHSFIENPSGNSMNESGSHSSKIHRTTDVSDEWINMDLLINFPPGTRFWQLIIEAVADLTNGEFMRLDGSIVTGDRAEQVRRRIANDGVEISEEMFRKLAWPLDDCVCDSEPAEADQLERIEAEYLTPPERGSW
jgi:hypothetical protein